MSPDDPRVDDLRHQLKALGYLDAGVDRFLLAPARGTRGPIALAARSSVRAGVLGGALLGPSAAVGLGARLPGLISGVRDAVVLALYLGILFFLGVAALSFIVSLATAALVRTRHDGFARHARLASATAGWIVSAACLVYLTLWWRNANAGFGWSAPVWTSFALVVAVGISLLVGHAVRITTLAVLGSAGGAAVGLPPVPAMSWRMVAAGAAAFAGAAILLVLSASTAVPPAAPALTVVSTGTRVRVVAIDGFDMRTYLDHYDAATHVSKALHSASLIAVQDTTDPARAWTTLATGAVPDIHGVHGIETRRVAGLRGILASRGSQTWQLLGAAGDLVRLTRPSIASRDERRVKTVWEVAADAGLRTAVVNWWATWPAAGSGIVITDRAILRLEQGGALDAEIAPADLYVPLRQAWPAIRARATAAAANVFDQVGDPGAGAILRRSAELDVTILEILRALPGPPRDLDMVYLPGLDIAQHALLAPGAGGAPAPSAIAARVAALGAYYEFLQTLIEPLVNPRDDETTIVVLEPGRVETPSEGHIAVTGRLGAPGSATVGTPLDVAPTIAYALGLPLSRELTGQPMRGMLARGLLERYPVRYVASYGRPFTPLVPRQGQPLDQEMIDRLRSLGYVK